MAFAHMCCGISTDRHTHPQTHDQWDVHSEQDKEQIPTLPVCVYSCKRFRPSRSGSDQVSRPADDEFIEFNEGTLAVQPAARGGIAEKIGWQESKESTRARAQLVGRAINRIILAEYDKIPTKEEELTWTLQDPVARSDLLLLQNPEVEYMDTVTTVLRERSERGPSHRLSAISTQSHPPTLTLKGRFNEFVQRNLEQSRQYVHDSKLSFWQAIPCKSRAIDDEQKKPSALRPSALGARILYLLLLLIAVIITAVVTIGNRLGDNFMISDDVPMRGDPSYLVDFLGGKCLYLKRSFGSLLLKMEAHNKRMGWSEVVFPARDDMREVRALYFAAAARSPRVILAHGIAANYLDSAVQTTAHFLRLMNISALVPNLRNHAGGDGSWKGKHLRQWRDQYLDILGAWDYAVTDPKGQLGGSLPANLVGMMGFEFGGFAAQAAFGAEPRLKTLLLDGAVHDVRALLDEMVDMKAPLSLGWMFKQQAWSRCEADAARKLHRDTVEVAEQLRARRAAGVLGIIHSLDDQIVPIQQQRLLLDTIAGGYESSIKVILKWFPSFRGDSNCEARSEIHMDRPQEYQNVLCAFWWTVFSDFASPDRYSKSRCPMSLADFSAASAS